ncbi:sterol desaturase family protein [Paraglaciecola sp. 2405UD69-4]|uniref:sterol desaturase family protein n=1 Tax=Paraglaciecola sp. 2405UD69-4 TaxID=3391836 RepID=UPI0039C953FE
MPTPIEILLDPISISLLGMYIFLILIEAIAPAQKQQVVKGWIPKSLFVFLCYFLLSSYLPLLWDKYLLPFQIFNLQQLHPALSAAVAVFAFELLIYIWHRALHQVNGLWRAFHQMHHSAERLDTFGAFYLSPMDMIGFTFIGSLALTIVVGISPLATSWFLYITMFLVIFQHTNIRTPQWLGYFIQRPESHSVHHQQGVHKYNYSDLPIFDIIFGTFKNPKNFAAPIGLYQGSSNKVIDLLLFKDIYKSSKIQKATVPLTPKDQA